MALSFEMQGSTRMLTVLVFVKNFFFFVAGCGITTLGIYLQITMKSYFDILGESAILSSSLIFIIVGVIITLVSFLGCCAACTENRCMMGSYAALLLLVLLAECVVTIMPFVYKGKAEKIVHDALAAGQKSYNISGHDGVTKSWDSIQQKFECCGLENYTDWQNMAFQNGDVNKAPDSCCRKEARNCGEGQLTAESDKIYRSGCYDNFKEMVKKNIYLVGAAGIGIALFQLISIIVACVLGRRLGFKYQFV